MVYPIYKKIKTRSTLNADRFTLNADKGFTLIEFLIYSAIATVLTVALVSMSIDMLQGRAKARVMEDVSHNARFAMEKIRREVRGAEELVSPTKGNSSSSMELKNENGETVIFDLSAEALRVSRGGGIEVITTDTVSVTELEFLNVSSSTDTGGAMKIKMVIEAVNPLNRQEFDFGGTFYTTENVRR